MVYETILKLIQTLSLPGQLIALAPLVKLIVLDLFMTRVEGDVAGLAPLVKLTKLVLYDTKVEGNVAGLAPLVKLTKLDLNGTKVEGDHEKLKAIQAERAAASP